MKKTILAIMIPALFATSASAVEIYSAEDGSSIDLYGRLEYEAGGLEHKKEKKNTAAKESNDRQSFGGRGEARAGVNVKYVLDDATALIGKYEAKVQSEDDDKSATRYAWLGFRFNDTTDLTFGKSEAARAQLSDLTDTFDIFGGEVMNAGGYNRVDDQVRLAYADNGLDLRASYAFNDQRKDVTGNNGDGNDNTRLGLSAGYTLPVGFGVVASYSEDKRSNVTYVAPTPVTDPNNETKMSEWGLGAHYTIEGFYFAGLYGQRDFTMVGEDNGGTKFWEVQGAYNIEEWTLLANYANEKGRKADSGEKITSEYTLGARYAFTPKTKVYAEYVINDFSGKDDLYGVGIQYNF